MLKEVSGDEVITIARKSCPPDSFWVDTDLHSFKPWRQLGGMIYGAMRRGVPSEVIWSEMSRELQSALRGSGLKEARLLTPYIAQLVVDMHNSLITDTERMSVEDLMQMTPASPVNSFIRNKS